MSTNHKIIHGDSRRMQELADESIHLAITSPPYWQLKDYGKEEQIGYNDSYEQYINHLNLVWQECHRVLQPDCRLCVNIGDQFARSVYYGRYKVIPIRTEIIKFCETVGFDYMGAIIWQKVTTTNTSGGATIMGSFPYPRNGIIKLDYEFILIFKKVGSKRRIKTDKEIKEQSKMTTEEWNTYFAGHWNFPGEKQSKHIAMFPEELPRRLIKMFSFVGDTVLDPFLGSGTTSLAAKNLGRHSAGYEMNEDFLPIIKEKLGGEDLFDDSSITLEKQNPLNLNFEDEIGKLPYIFKDAVKVDKKIDPKSRQFGSKIDKKGKQNEKYFRVKQIISPEKLLLSDGTRVRLLGVRELPEKQDEAMRFLEQKTSGQRVFMKFDKIKEDEEKNLLCYLYLANKTFLNAHLIKRGLAEVDRSREFRTKERFIKMSPTGHSD